MTPTPTESFADDAAIASIESTYRVPPPATVEYPLDDLTRHVLIIEPSGMTYVAIHAPETKHDPEQCLAMPYAVDAFLAEGTPMTPGRYWISVGADGNLELGGRVRA